MSLLVVGVLGADDHYFAMPFDDLALVTHRFYAGSDFHFSFSFDFLLQFVGAPVNDASRVEVVGAHRDLHLIAHKDFDVVYAHLAG